MSKTMEDMFAFFCLIKNPCSKVGSGSIKVEYYEHAFFNSENVDFLPKNQQKKPKHFIAASPQIFAKKADSMDASSKNNIFFSGSL